MVSYIEAQLTERRRHDNNMLRRTRINKVLSRLALVLVVGEYHLDSECWSGDPGVPGLECWRVHLDVGDQTAVRDAELDEGIGDLG